jgi:cysteine synthase
MLVPAAMSNRNNILDRGYQQTQMMPSRTSPYGPLVHQNFGTNISHIEPAFNSSSTSSMVRSNAWEPSAQYNAKINQNQNQNQNNVTAGKEQSV